MNKKILTMFFLLSVLPFSYAVISDYRVPDVVPLNRPITFYGVTDTSDQLCSFFLFDTVDGNYPVIRLSDEYSNEYGQFYSEFVVTSPLFRRGFDYNAVVVCGGSIASQLFYVEQKEDIFFGITSSMIMNDIAFWTNSDNSLTVVFILIGLLIAAAIFYGLYNDLSGPNIWTGKPGR